jgi:predicted small lipoprotein YifL
MLRSEIEISSAYRRPQREGVRLTVAGASVVAAALTLAFAGCGDLILPPEDVTADGGRSSTGNGQTDLPLGEIDCNPDSGDPSRSQYLGCTGLYSDWKARTISPDAKPFDPGLHLWSDGAAKERFIYLPPGSQIDTTDQNEWVFPVGTKVWKTFSLLGKKVETRYLFKVDAITWFRTTYAWDDNEIEAIELTGGRTNVRGLGYEIPVTDNCATCHMGRKDFLLGFDLVSLGSPEAKGLNLAQLKAANLLTNPPSVDPVIPGDATATAAFGYLHANCGTACHSPSPSAFAGTTGLFMRLEVEPTGALPNSPTLTNTYKTAVNKPSEFAVPNEPPGSFLRIRGGSPEKSVIPWRDGRRDRFTQMPPLATHIRDEEGLAKIVNWIKTLPPPP